MHKVSRLVKSGCPMVFKIMIIIIIIIRILSNLLVVGTYFLSFQGASVRAKWLRELTYVVLKMLDSDAEQRTYCYAGSWCQL